MDLKNIGSPVTVGVTGHRNIAEEDKPAIKRKVKKKLEEIIALNKNTPIVMLNSLAQGADMLCADVAFGLNIPVIAVLPCEEERYVLSFDESEKPKLAHYIARAEKVIVAPDTEKAFEKINADGNLITKESYEYRQAGIYVAERSQILVALWDGKPPKVKYGCGTAEAVGFAREKGREIIWIKCRRRG